MTDEELDAIERRAAAATSGPWYFHSTDDAHFMNARYVGTSEKEPSDDHPTRYQGLCDGAEEQVHPRRVVAITLLQEPSLAGPEEYEENTTFIAHARTDVPKLVAEIRRLRAELDQRPPL
jgi:hypothetical protein